MQLHAMLRTAVVYVILSDLRYANTRTIGHQGEPNYSLLNSFDVRA